MEVSLVQLSQKIECVYNQTVSKPKIDTVYIYTMAATVSRRGITVHQLLRRPQLDFFSFVGTLGIRIGMVRSPQVKAMRVEDGTKFKSLRAWD